jgi:predicted amidohydrolase YtcJ
MPLADPSTRIIDLKARRVLPGLIDNHLHIIRGAACITTARWWRGGYGVTPKETGPVSYGIPCYSSLFAIS